jgi:hypothetical protein
VADEGFPKWTRVRVTQDWVHYCMVCSEVLSGNKGEEFFVDIYIPASKSDSGFDFYWMRGSRVPVPARFVERADK